MENAQPVRITEAASPKDSDATDSVWMDEAVAPLNGFFSALSAVPEDFIDHDLGLRLSMETMRISLPVEMDIYVNDQNRVSLAGAPPTQYTETSIMPVFHQVTLHLVAATEVADG